MPPYMWSDIKTVARDFQATMSMAKAVGDRYGVPPTAVVTALAVDLRVAEIARSQGVKPPVLTSDEMFQEAVQAYAQYMFKRSGSPVWALTEETAFALAHSDAPVEDFSRVLMEERFRLPFPGMYLAVPPVFPLQDSAGENFPIQGVFLCENPVLPPHILRAILRQEPPEVALKVPDQALSPGIALLGYSTCRGVTPWGPDNTFSFALIASGQATPAQIAGVSPGHRMLLQLVTNFLWALHSSYLDATRVVQPRKKRAALKQKRPGLPHVYTRVNIKRSVIVESRKHQKTGTGTTRASHLVRGHWHAYWRKDPGDKAIVDTKVSPQTGETLYKVLYWILPYYTGDPAKAKARYISNPRPTTYELLNWQKVYHKEWGTEKRRKVPSGYRKRTPRYWADYFWAADVPEELVYGPDNLEGMPPVFMVDSFGTVIWYNPEGHERYAQMGDATAGRNWVEQQVLAQMEKQGIASIEAPPAVDRTTMNPRRQRGR
jgi:hypothetical protein